MFVLKSFLYFSTNLVNSSFKLFNSSSVVASNLKVILGPVLLARTNAQDSSLLTLSPSIVRQL